MRTFPTLLGTDGTENKNGPCEGRTHGIGGSRHHALPTELTDHLQLMFVELITLEPNFCGFI